MREALEVLERRALEKPLSVSEARVVLRRRFPEMSSSELSRALLRWILVSKERIEL